MALAFKLFLHQLRVAVRADRHWRRPRQEVNPVIQLAWWREPGWCGEDIVKFFQQKRQQIDGVQLVDRRGNVTANRSLPHYPMINAPVAHASPHEIPQNWSQGAQPVHSQHDIVAVQQNDEEINDELLSVDEDVRCAADSRSHHPVAVGNLDREVRPGPDVQLQAGHSPNEDEGVCRVGVDQGL
jgi:hypothetical protein